MEETQQQQQQQEEDALSLEYFHGFGNTFESECIPGALPIGRNNPRVVPFNLYSEQLSGTAFTVSRHINRRVWLYRMQPSVATTKGSCENTVPHETLNYFGESAPDTCSPATEPLRWLPQHSEVAALKADFLSGTYLLCNSATTPSTKNGLAIYVYAFGVSMKENQSHFYNSDGDFLFVPQQGSIEIITEVGKLKIEPTEICVIPRGLVFQVNLLGTARIARGYLLEVHSDHGFQLPELGPIGSNGLANARDFCYPKAWCVRKREFYRQGCSIHFKSESRLYSKKSDHSPFNVVAWHGNYLPYKYDLKRFCAMNSVSYDHPDPSIYTVLTCPSSRPGVALADFVIFPHRVMATDSNTFRPPWFHRNTMSEFMGLIYGNYDAKVQTANGGGFQPGGASLHNCMIPHGPDSASYEKAVADPCDQPKKFEGGLAFMFETYLPLNVVPIDENPLVTLDENYADCWQNLDEKFTGWDLLAEHLDSV